MSSTLYGYQSQLVAEWKAEGRTEGEARAVLRALEHREIQVPEEARQRILECTDSSQADTWLDRALTAITVDDLFA